MKKLISWSDKKQRLDQLDAAVSSRKTVNFGAELLSALDKRDRVRAHFDSVAHRYDLMNTVLSLGMHRIWKYRAVKNLELKPGEYVLDLCGGTGDLALIASKQVGDTGRVAVCDLTLSMMEKGKDKNPQSNISWIQGDALSIPLPDSKVNAAMIGFGLRNLTYPEKGLREIARVLRPGGRLLCLEFSRPNNPVMRKLYDVYSFKFMPLMGRIIAGNSLAYLRLAETIRMFCLPEEVRDMMLQAGFYQVQYKLLTFGVASIHLARKAKV